MRTLVLYASSYGYAKEMAEHICAGLNDDVKCINLNVKQNLDLNDVDTIVLGSSIYVGQIHKSMKEFIKVNHDLLLKKRLVIYVCCAFEHEFENHLKNNIPIELLEHASMIQNLGGAIDKSKLNFGHKMMVSMIEKTEAGKKPILRHEDRVQAILSHLNT